MLVLLLFLSIFFVVYTYVGYPVILAVLAKIRPFSKKKAYDKNSTLFVTLIITAYNEELVIEKKIQNSLLLDYASDKLQIIVAADGSSDKTAEIVRQFAGQVELNYIPQRQGKMAAINRAMSIAKGDIVVFSDANNMYEPDVLRKLVSPFSDLTVGATTGAKLIVQDGGDLSSAEGFYWKYESWIKKNQTTLGTCTSSVGEMLAVRREYYNHPPNNIINDDYYIVLDLIRRGYRVIYVDDALSYEHISVTAQDEITRRSRISTGHYQAISMSLRLLPFNRPLVVWHIVSHKFFRALLPFGFIIIFLTSLLIPLVGKSGQYDKWSQEIHQAALILLLSQFVFYALGLMGNVIKFPGFPGKIVYICTYLVNSNFALFMGFWKYITKKQSNIWERVRRENT